MEASHVVWSPSIHALGGRFKQMLGSLGQAGLGRVPRCQIMPCLAAGGAQPLAQYFWVKLVLLALPQIACPHITILWQEV